MYNILYNLYFACSRRWMENSSLLNSTILKVVSFVVKFYLNCIYRSLLLLWGAKYTTLPKVQGEEVIVSLTTFPARINKVYITIETIFQQDTLPNRIILWLANEQFPEGLYALPQRLLNMQQRGLEIKFCEDIRSHKKYYYSIKNNPDSIVITVDDDVFYPKDTLTNLLMMHYQHPYAIICNSAQEIPDDYTLPPSLWNTPHFNRVNNLFGKCRILGISGVLYPAHSLCHDVFNNQLRQKLCPWADDLWLTIMAMLNGTIIQRYEFRSNPLDVLGTQRFNLSRGGDLGYSVTQGVTNDDQWHNLITYYAGLIVKQMENNNRKCI